MILELSKILLHLSLTLAGGIVVAVIAILFIILLKRVWRMVRDSNKVKT